MNEPKPMYRVIPLASQSDPAAYAEQLQKGMNDLHKEGYVVQLLGSNALQLPVLLLGQRTMRDREDGPPEVDFGVPGFHGSGLLFLKLPETASLINSLARVIQATDADTRDAAIRKLSEITKQQLNTSSMQGVLEELSAVSRDHDKNCERQATCRTGPAMRLLVSLLKEALAAKLQ